MNVTKTSTNNRYFSYKRVRDGKSRSSVDTFSIAGDVSVPISRHSQQITH